MPFFFKNKVLTLFFAPYMHLRPYFSGSQRDQVFQNQNSGCRLTGRMSLICSLIKYMIVDCTLQNTEVQLERGPGGQSFQNLADQLTLFEPGWTEFAPHYCQPPEFKKLSTPLHQLVCIRKSASTKLGNTFSLCNYRIRQTLDFPHSLIKYFLDLNQKDKDMGINNHHTVESFQEKKLLFSNWSFAFLIMQTKKQKITCSIRRKKHVHHNLFS